MSGRLPIMAASYATRSWLRFAAREGPAGATGDRWAGEGAACHIQHESMLGLIRLSMPYVMYLKQSKSIYIAARRIFDELEHLKLLLWHLCWTRSKTQDSHDTIAMDGLSIPPGDQTVSKAGLGWSKSFLSPFDWQGRGSNKYSWVQTCCSVSVSLCISRKTKFRNLYYNFLYVVVH